MHKAAFRGWRRHLFRIVPTFVLFSAVYAYGGNFAGSLDGVAREWHIIQEHDRSSASFREFAPAMYNFTIQGYAEPRHATKGALSISFTYLNGQLVGDPEMMYFPSSRLFPVYRHDNGSGQWSIETITIEGDHARISGSYRGTLKWIENIHAAPDPENTIELEFRFDVTAAREH